MNKHTKIYIIALLLVFTLPVNEINAGKYVGWQKINDNMYYFNEEGKMLTGIQEIDGQKYLLGATSGKLYYGWTPAPDGYTYYTNSEGIIQTGIQEIDGKKYLLGATSGRLYYGLTPAPDGYTYYTDKNGIIQYGWIEINKNKYYFDELGRMLVGWKEIEGEKYYFNEEGKMLTGIQEIGGQKYLLGATSGKLYYGWTPAPDGFTYYTNSEGIIQTGIQEIDGKKYLLGATSGRLYYGWTPAPDGYTYYTNNEGIIQTGIQEINGKKYLLGATSGRLYYGLTPAPDGYTYYTDKNGIIQYGWIEIDKDKYCFDKSGHMLVGWQKIEKEKYYFNNEGKMLTGIQEINGKRYLLGATSGRLYYGWTPAPDGHTYYTNSEGIIQTGELTIDGSAYRFDSYGRLQSGWQTINGKKYYFYANGNKAKGIVKIAGIRYEFSSDGVLLNSNIRLVLDVSKWQGDINWDTLWKSGAIDAVILRMGYGTESDFKFEEYLSNVKRLGIPYSIYWFSYAKSKNDALAEANKTISLYNSNKLSPTFNIYYDLEDWQYLDGSLNSYDISKTTYQTIAETYINTLKKNGISAKIYANSYFYNSRFNSETRKYVEWIANYSSSTNPGNFRGWQFTSSGSVPGISGNVDLNIFYW